MVRGSMSNPLNTLPCPKLKAPESIPAKDAPVKPQEFPEIANNNYREVL